MKLFGVTLFKPAQQQQQQEWFSREDALPGRTDKPKIKTMPRRRNIIDSIIFPSPLDPNNAWEVQRLKNLVDGVQNYWVKGWFDICLVRDAIRDFKLELTGPARASYEKLHLLHCIHFDKMVPGLEEQIPGLLTHIFTEGQVSPDGPSLSHLP